MSENPPIEGFRIFVSWYNELGHGFKVISDFFKIGKIDV